MDSRTKGWIATIASVVLCGCPGLVLCAGGAAVAAGAPVTTELNGVSNSTSLPIGAGIAALCGALVLILIPVAVAFFTLRTKPAPVTMIPPSEPMPPAS